MKKNGTQPPALLPPAPDRFYVIVLSIDKEQDLGEQVVVYRYAGWPWKFLEKATGRTRQTLHTLAEEARARLGVSRETGK